MEIWKIIKNYKFIELLGKGKYSNVYKAIDVNSNVIYSVKVISKEDRNNCQEFLDNETKNLNILKHHNVINLIEFFESHNNYYLVFDYCDIGSLDDILMKRHTFNQLEYLNIFYQLLEGFKELYKNNIIHRDIKPSNILIKGNLIKISDFGFSTKLNNEKEMKKLMIGSPIYMSSEILKNRYYDVKTDIYSLGVTFYEIIFWKPPFIGNSIPELLSKINNKNDIFNNKKIINEDIKKLILKMLEINPNDRIDWNNLFIEFSKIYNKIKKQYENRELIFLKNLNKNSKNLIVFSEIIKTKANYFNKYNFKYNLYFNVLKYYINNTYDINQNYNQVFIILLIEKLLIFSKNKNLLDLKNNYIKSIKHPITNEDVKLIIENKNINIDEKLKFYIENFLEYITDNLLQRVILKDDKLFDIFFYMNLLLDIINSDQLIHFYIKGNGELFDEPYYKAVKQLEFEDLMLYVNMKLNYILN